ncbi:MAG: extracellular solute-binding protein [Rhodothermaceae bacterium]|nr:extracellular solute-binding protein [Rhodothermaceae bacterium]
MRYPILLLTILLLFVVGCTSTPEKATLVIYSPHGKEMLNRFENIFEEAHPEVDVQWIDMGGQNAYDRIRTEKERPQASIWWGGSSMAFNRAAVEGLLEPYSPSWADAVTDDMHDHRHMWYGTFLTPEVIAFNSRTLPNDEDIPKDWDDLLEPQWKDRVLIRYPLASATMRTIFGAMIMRQPTVEEGYAWLAKLDMNTKTYTADPTQLYLKLAREEGDVSFWNMPDIFLQQQENEYPFGFLIPLSGTPVLTDGIALVKNGPNLDWARKFYEMATSEEAMILQANEFFRIPSRQDIDPSQLPAWIANTDIQPMSLDWERLAEEGPGWMKYWDENIKGRGADYLEEQGMPTE